MSEVGTDRRPKSLAIQKGNSTKHDNFNEEAIATIEEETPQISKSQRNFSKNS